MLISNCVKQISESIPELSPDVKERILDAVTVALADASDLGGEVGVELSPSPNDQGVSTVRGSLYSNSYQMATLTKCC